MVCWRERAAAFRLFCRNHGSDILRPLLADLFVLLKRFGSLLLVVVVAFVDMICSFFIIIITFWCVFVFIKKLWWKNCLIKKLNYIFCFFHLNLSFKKSHLNCFRQPQNGRLALFHNVRVQIGWRFWLGKFFIFTFFTIFVFSHKLSALSCYTRESTALRIDDDATVANHYANSFEPAIWYQKIARWFFVL